jgi:dTDP-4-dehydrorhamnose reductase
MEKKSAYYESDLPIPITRYGASNFEEKKWVCNEHARALMFLAGWLFRGLFEMKKTLLEFAQGSGRKKSHLFSHRQKRFAYMDSKICRRCIWSFARVNKGDRASGKLW